MVIEAKSSSKILEGLVRVLYVNKGKDLVLVIPIQPKRSGTRLYYVAPRPISLEKIKEEALTRMLRILQNGVTPRPDVLATDEELDKKYLRSGQTISIPREKRAQRYALIKPLVDNHEDRVLLLDPQVRRELIVKRAKEVYGDSLNERSIKEISEILYQYFAEGSTPGAVTPLSAGQGGRGKERKQKSKLGKPNTPTKHGAKDAAGFIMTEEDKENCGFAWRNYYIRGTTIAKALRKLWREFYSDISINKKGQTIRTPKRINERPSRTQFETWGKKRSPGHESWKKQLPKFNLNRMDRVLFGTSDEDITGVGQRGAVDSTSIDYELVSVANRLERIGTAHRILIVDGLHNYISGFYLGLEAPSAQTVGLAFLHSLTDKKEWLKWLGLEEQNPDDWIPIRYGSVLADNTDLRCEAVINKLDSIGTGIKFVGVARSDLNSAVETSHHVLHRMVDHNLHGTTHGQRHERGEEHAYFLARHTPIEAIRETARAIYLHNTMELDIRPTLEMRRDLLDKGIKLTRVNLTRWAINQGKCFTSLIGEDDARTKLLLPIRATFTPHGVKLLKPDSGKKREFIEPIRYVSNHPIIKKKVMESKVERARVQPVSFDDNFLHNPYKTTEIFYRDIYNGELIRLDIACKDKELPFECSLPDILNLMKQDEIHLFDVRASRDEALSDLEYAQELAKQDASNAYEEALNLQEKPPSKNSLKRNKKANRTKENEISVYGMPVQQTNSAIDSNSLNTGYSEAAPLSEETKVSDDRDIEHELIPVNKTSNNILLNEILRRRLGGNSNV